MVGSCGFNQNNSCLDDENYEETREKSPNYKFRKEDEQVDTLMGIGSKGFSIYKYLQKYFHVYTSKRGPAPSEALQKLPLNDKYMNIGLLDIWKSDNVVNLKDTQIKA